MVLIHLDGLNSFVQKFHKFDMKLRIKFRAQLFLEKFSCHCFWMTKD